MKISSPVIQRLYIYSMIVTLVAVPLLFYDKMMWSFHSPKNLFLQFAVFGLLFLHFFKPKTVFRAGLLDSVILLRVIFIALVSFFSGNIDNLFPRIDVLTFLTLFYFLMQLGFIQDKLHLNIKFTEKCFSWISFTGTLIALYGIMQYFGIDIFYPDGYSYYESRVVGTFGNANTMGGFLAAIFPFSIYTLFSSVNKKQKTFRAVCSLLIIQAIILTLSRGAGIALFVTALITGYFLIKSRLKINFTKKSYKIGSIALIILFIFLSAWKVYQFNPDSARGRLFLWKVSSTMIADYPLTGIGYGQYGTRYLDYQAKYFDDPANEACFDRAANIKQAHNEYIQSFTETGVFGVILFLLIFTTAYLNIFRMLRHAGEDKKENGVILALTASLSVIALHSLVDSPLHTLPVNIIFYFVLGLISFKTKQVNYERAFITFSFRNRLIFLLIAFGIFTYSSFDTIRKVNGYIAWRKGQDYVSRGEWFKGISKYEKAARILTGKGELMFHLGAAYAYTRQSEKALGYFERAKASFNDKNLYITKGTALYQLGRYEKAEASFRTALRMYPKLLLPRLWLAEMYIGMGRVQDAVKELTMITTIQPKVITDEIRSIKKDAEELLEIYATEKNE